MFTWIDRHLKTLLEIWVVLFTILVIYLFVALREEIDHNKTRSQQAKNLALKVQKQQKLIQEGRLHSCQTTYRSFSEILRGFADPKTAKERADLKKFDELVASKVRGCQKQIKAPKKERG
jgi:cbb3-type cytochrome oxidase subunit 3